jgi:hypothetical protein
MTEKSTTFSDDNTPGEDFVIIDPGVELKPEEVA